MSKKLTMKELPSSEQPYEKYLVKGFSGISDAELLAIILRNGGKDATAYDLAVSILNLHPSIKDISVLNHLSMTDLMQVSGIGKVKAIQLLSMAEFAKRFASCTHQDKLRLTNPSSIADCYMERLRAKKKEEVYALLFDSNSHLLKESLIAIGTVNSALISPREIFIDALHYGAVYFVLLHNHPSGNPTPSSHDLLLTKRVKEAGEYVGIALYDHIIIGDKKYYSMKERGVM